MFSIILAHLINKIIAQNNQLRKQLQMLSTKTISLKLSELSFQILIQANGLVSVNRSLDPDCIIHISSNNIIQQITSTTAATQDMLQELKISGDINLAKSFLECLAMINLQELIYLPQSNLYGIIAVRIESIVIQIIQYAKLIISNSSYSLSEYLKYESEFLVDKREIDRSNNEINHLNLAYIELTKRANRLLNP